MWPSQDSDQPAYPGSLIRLRRLHIDTLGPYLSVESTVKTDQTARMHKLIRPRGY